MPRRKTCRHGESGSLFQHPAVEEPGTRDPHQCFHSEMRTSVAKEGLGQPEASRGA